GSQVPMPRARVAASTAPGAAGSDPSIGAAPGNIPAPGADPSLEPGSNPAAGGPQLPAPSTGGAGGGSASAGAGGGSASDPAAQATAAKVDPGVVDIETVLGYQGGRAAGTGMVLNASGEVLTNNHVVDRATQIVAVSVTTGKRYGATVVGTDPTEDVAVIQLRGATGLPTVPLGDSTALAVGSPVVAIGNAGGAGGTPTASSGRVKALNQTMTASDFGGADAETLHGLIETDAPLQPGMSGGPLATSAARVIGMDTAASVGRRFSSGVSVGFAIPINHALDIARQIEAGQASATVHIGPVAFLGVSSAAATNGNGVVISGVVPGGPAQSAGLRSGDVVTSVDGQPVSTSQALAAAIRRHQPGETTQLTWTDQSGATRTATVRLGTAPAD
ncbi:MAG TPA: trypsin-like peptidase domain-containing protein, partial [Acidimicrobiales bacterium]